MPVPTAGAGARELGSGGWDFFSSLTFGAPLSVIVMGEAPGGDGASVERCQARLLLFFDSYVTGKEKNVDVLRAKVGRTR